MILLRKPKLSVKGISAPRRRYKTALLEVHSKWKISGTMLNKKVGGKTSENGEGVQKKLKREDSDKTEQSGDW